MSEDTICEECDDLYSLRDGCEPSKYCDECAQDVVIRIARELAAAIERAEKAEMELESLRKSFAVTEQCLGEDRDQWRERAEKAEMERERWIADAMAAQWGSLDAARKDGKV